MKNPFKKKVKDLGAISETMLAAKIALAATIDDPYAHHWCRQSNYTIVCDKCGITHLCKVFDGRVYNKCWMHDSHLSQAN